MLTKQEIRQLGNKDMVEELKKARRELLKSQFDLRMGTSKEVHTMKNLRKYIARLTTIEGEVKKTTDTSKASIPTKELKQSKPVKKSPAPKKTTTKATKSHS